MSPLRQQMIEAMRQRGFSVRTHESYLGAVQDLAKFHRRPPDQIQPDELQRYFNHLAQERGLSGASCRVHLGAIRFFYREVLQWPAFETKIAVPKRAQRIPELLTRAEVARICAATRNLKHRSLLLTCYGCGLRVSELVALRVRDIDGERHLLRVTEGKGVKDRLVIASEGLLAALRAYWRHYHPHRWLFPGAEPEQALSIPSVQRVFTAAKARAQVEKIGGIHGLRHAYATHQLEAGLRIDLLQRQLGHSDIRTTLTYVHWVPDYRELKTPGADLVAALEVDHV